MPTTVKSLVDCLEERIASSTATKLEYWRGIRSTPVQLSAVKDQPRKFSTVSPTDTRRHIRDFTSEPGAYKENYEPGPISTDIAQEGHIHALLGYGRQLETSVELNQRQNGKMYGRKSHVVSRTYPFATTNVTNLLRDCGSRVPKRPPHETQLLCDSYSEEKFRGLVQDKGKEPQRQISVRSQAAEEYYRSSLYSQSESTRSFDDGSQISSIDQQLDHLMTIATPPNMDSDQESPPSTPTSLHPLAYYIPSGAESMQYNTPERIPQVYILPEDTAPQLEENSPPFITNTAILDPFHSSPDEDDDSSIARPETVLSDFSFNKPTTSTPFYSPYALQNCQFCSKNQHNRRISGSVIEKSHQHGTYTERSNSLSHDTDNSVITVEESLTDLAEEYMSSAWEVPVEHLYAPIEQVVVDRDCSLTSTHPPCKWWKRLFCNLCPTRGRGTARTTGTIFPSEEPAKCGADFEVFKGGRTTLRDEELVLNVADRKDRWWSPKSRPSPRNKLLKRSPPRATQESFRQIRNDRSSLQYLTPPRGPSLH